MTKPVKLELFGVDHSYRYQLIKQRLVEILDNAGLDYTLTDISRIEDFIEAGLESVPSIRVDSKQLFSMSGHDDPDRIIQSVYNYILGEIMGILAVPIDFSPISRNAARYAVKLAAHFGLRVELVHVYHPVVDPHNAVIIDPDLGDTYRKHLEDMAQELRDKSKSAGVKNDTITSRYLIGYPLSSIVELAKDEQIEMLVMGTLGSTNILDDVFGNISSSVAIQTNKPLLLVPPKVEFTPPRQIMVAFNEELIANGAIDQLLSFNKPFKAHIDFVHISESSRNGFEAMRDKLMAVLVGSGTTEFSFDVRQIDSSEKDIADDIMATAEAINPDLLTLVPRHRSFIQRLFHTSVTRKLCLHGDRPMLVLHPND